MLRSSIALTPRRLKSYYSKLTDTHPDSQRVTPLPRPTARKVPFENINPAIEDSSSKRQSLHQILNPRRIKESLDLQVVSCRSSYTIQIGQDALKKSLSVAVFKHQLRIQANQENRNIVVEKSNVLILGPTGSGKTLISKSIANILSFPFSINDATPLVF